MWLPLLIIGVVYAVSLWATRKILGTRRDIMPLFGPAYKKMQDQFKTTVEDKYDRDEWVIK